MRLALLINFFFLVHLAYAQLLELNNYAITTYKTSFKKLKDSPKFWNEVPPWVVKSKWHQYFFTTHFTTVWSSPLSLADPKDNFIFVERSQGSSTSWIVSSSHWWGKFYDPEFLASSGYRYNFEWENHHWRRSYNGIFSAHVIHHAPSDKNILFAVSHGENKNERIGNYLYQNTVRNSFIIDKHNAATYSGGDPYQDCWEAYFGFLNGNWIFHTDNSNQSPGYMYDIGPLAWPSAGYLNQDGSQASKGLRHPSSIIHCDYLYIYVIDESMDGTGGVKLIRSHLDDILSVNSYETWAAGQWIASLPEGYSKDRVSLFFKQRGPDNTPIFPPDRSTIRFSVAKIKGTANFIGVEEYIMGQGDNTIKVAFRLSNDLINWSDRIEFFSASNWFSSNLRYPIFLNREGTSNTEVDLEEFYILGSSSSGTITKYYFKLNESATSPAGSIRNNLWANANGSKLTIPEFTASPVPASYTIDIKFKVPSTSTVVLELYDVKGSKVGTLLDDLLMPQFVTKTFDISYLKPGIYIIELLQNGERQHQRIVKL